MSFTAAPDPATQPSLSAAALLRLYSANTLDEFLTAAHHAFAGIVPCGWVSAFYRRADAGEGFLEERDSRGRVWSGRFMRRYAELTPAVPLVVANPGIKLLATRAVLQVPERQLRQSSFYREVMCRQGWRHGAVLCFWTDPPGPFPIFVLTFYRTADEPDFADDELTRLEQAHAYLAPAVHRFHHTSAVDSMTEGMAIALRHVPAGVVVLDWQLHLVRSNLSGRRSCAAWHRAIQSDERAILPGVPVLPQDLLRRCRSLRRATSAALRESSRRRSPRLQATVVSDSGFTATITVVCAASELAEPAFVIEFKRTLRRRESASRRLALTTLTGSERQVALLVAEGRSNQEASEQLGKTVHAVKFLLHRVYAKLAVSNRVQLSLLVNRKRPHTGLRTTAAAPSKNAPLP